MSDTILLSMAWAGRLGVARIDHSKFQVDLVKTVNISTRKKE